MKLDKFKKYGDLNTHDIFKFFAILFMIIDHIGFYLFDIAEFKVIGRICLPILAVIYGYHFKNKVDKNLIIWGIPIIFIDLFIKKSIFPLNILFSFAISGIVIKYYNLNKYKLKEWDKKIIFPILLILHFYLSHLFIYGTFIILFMICGFLFNKDENKNRYVITFGIFWYYLIEQSMRFNFNLIYIIIFAILLFYVYSKLKTYKLKYYTKPINTKLKNTIIFIGRYSMEVYVVHLAIFKLVGFWIKK